MAGPTQTVEQLFPPRPFQIARRNIQPPSDLLIPPEASLRVTSLGSLAGQSFVLRSRVLRADGSVMRSDYTVTNDGSRVANVNRFPVGDGFLLSVVVDTIAVPPQRGELFVSVSLAIGLDAAAVPVQTLFADYATAADPPTWPHGRVISSVESAGAFRTVVGTDPPAGNIIVETVPTGARWRLHSLKCTLVCDAIVANRTPRIVLLDNLAKQSGYGLQPLALTAGQTGIMTFATLGYTMSSGVGLLFFMVSGLPQQTILRSGYQIMVLVDFGGPADNFGPPVMLVEEWLEG